jgi:hypothetical protein
VTEKNFELVDKTRAAVRELRSLTEKPSQPMIRAADSVQAGQDLFVSIAVLGRVLQLSASMILKYYRTK